MRKVILSLGVLLIILFVGCSQHQNQLSLPIGIPIGTNNSQIVYSDSSQCPVCNSGNPYDVNCLISVANYESLCSRLKPRDSPIGTISDGFLPNGFSNIDASNNPRTHYICSFAGNNGQIGYCYYRTNQKIQQVRPVSVYPSMGGFNVCLIRCHLALRGC